MREIAGLLLTDDQYDRLISMLSAQRSVGRVDYTTPLIGKEFDNVPDEGRAVLAASLADYCKLDGLPLWMREIEAAARLKHGTMSRCDGYGNRSNCPLAAAVMRYFERYSVHIEAHAAGHADRFVSSLISTPNGNFLEPASLDRARMSFERRTGFGWPVMSSDPCHEPLVAQLSKNVLEYQGHRSELPRYPAIVGVRNQAAGPYMKAKQRLIYQMSRVWGNIEKMYFIPMFKALRDLPIFAAWGGRTSVDVGVTGMFEDCRGPFLSVDYANFDASVSREVIQRIFRIIRGWFSRQQAPMLVAIETHFSECGIITPLEEYKYSRTRGIPSGSVLTNLVGSLVNLWSMAYAANRCGVSIHRCLVQGDDGVYTFRGDVAPVQLSSVMLADLGMVMSVDKNYNSPDEIHFLSMVHRRSYKTMGLNVGIRPLMRVLNGMMSYERLQTQWSGYMDSLRWFQQLDNASEHPMFSAACEWLLARDRYARLSLDELIVKAGGKDLVTTKLGTWSDTTGSVMARLGRNRVQQQISRLCSGN